MFVYTQLYILKSSTQCNFVFPIFSRKFSWKKKKINKRSSPQFCLWFCYFFPKIVVISKKKKNVFTLTWTCISHFWSQLHINPNKKLPFVKTVYCFWFFDRHCKGGWHVIQTFPLVVLLEDLLHFFVLLLLFCILQQVAATLTD